MPRSYFGEATPESDSQTAFNRTALATWTIGTRSRNERRTRKQIPRKSTALVVSPPRNVTHPFYFPQRVIGSLRLAKFCWVGKHVNITMKPTNSPTQGQPNPRKSRLKVTFGPPFPTENTFFRGLGLVLHRKQIRRNPTHAKILSANTLVFGRFEPHLFGLSTPLKLHVRTSHSIGYYATFNITTRKE